MAQKTLTLDCQYLYPQYAAAFLVTDEDRGLFIENNTAHSIPILLSALKAEGINPKAVEFLIITHVHLDHAGGSSALMKACPNAILLAHPRAASHIINPSRLVKSAKEVYGEAIFEKLYGKIEPIPSERVRTMEDGESISFKSKKLRFIHTRGHANHHLCVFDEMSESIFTGDSFGLAYPALQKNGLFIFPSTSPTDFDPVEAKLSVEKILNLKPKRAYLTHFGEVHQIREAADQLIEQLNFSETLMYRAVSCDLSDEKLVEFCERELNVYLLSIMEKRSLASDKYCWEIMKNDLKLNAAGIAYSAKKIRSKQNQSQTPNQ